MHNLAAFCASSTEMLVGTCPLNCTCPSFTGICPDTKIKFPVLTTGMYEPAGLGGVGSDMPSNSNFSSNMVTSSGCLDFNIHISWQTSLT